MSQVLYRKYRPKTFAEIEGQDHVVRTLQGALMSGRVGHAYLFCGPRGTGKTTMARLLAKSLNCLNYDKNGAPEKIKGEVPCNKCGFCNAINDGNSLDLVEIDAASNRGIDEIRNLKESAQVAAPGAGYKVFIIDEVHMLTPAAFNALLKILEEPPSHVVFILATTEPHKVFDTILSRVQRFDFKKISTEKMVEKLKRIAKAEKINIEESALAALAFAASGSLRDAESSLSKLIAYTGSEKITAEDAAEILGVVPLQTQKNLVDLIVQKKPQEAIAQISNLFESGIELEYFNRQFVKYLRTLLIARIDYVLAPANTPAVQAAVADQRSGPGSNADMTPEFLIRAINLFVKAGAELKFSPIPQLPLELAVLELTKAS
jgi:DNA polymerase-3 subunit gamma/tau